MRLKATAWSVFVAVVALIQLAPTAGDGPTALPPVSAAPEGLLFVDLGSYRDTVRLALVRHDGHLNVRELRFSSDSQGLLSDCRPEDVRVHLSLTQGAWIAPRPGSAQRTVTLAALAAPGRRLRRRVLDPSAVLAILDEVERACTERGVPVAAEFAVDTLGPLSTENGEGVLEIRLSRAEHNLS